MAASADIYGRIQQPRGSNLLRDFAGVLNVQQGMQQNQLGQMKMQEYERANTERNSLADVWRSGVRPDGTLDRAAVLSGAASRGLGAMIPKFQQDFTAQDKATVDLDSAKTKAQGEALENASKKIDLAGRTFGAVRQNPTPETAMAAIEYLAQNGVYTSEQAMQYIGKIQAEPGKVAEMADMAFRAALDAKEQLAKISTQNLGGMSQTTSTDPVSGRSQVLRSDEITQSADNAASNARQAADAAAGRAVTMRGQNMTDSRAREGTWSMNNDTGYMVNSRTGQTRPATGPDGKPMPPAPAGKPMTELQLMKRRDQIAKDHKAAVTTLANMEDLLTSANEVITAPGLRGATGLQSYLPSWPDGGAARAEVKLKNLEGKVTQLGKAAAAMAGAIGPMAVQEWKIVRDMIAAIEPQKGEEALKEQVRLVESTAQGAIQRIREAYEKQYGPDFERFPEFQELPQPKAMANQPTPRAGNSAGPKPGTVEGGYRFKGGNPADAKNWEKM